MNKRALLQNMKRLKIDLSDTDCVVLSHGHLDQPAATVEIVKGGGGVRVYGHPHTSLCRLHKDKTGKRRPLGVPKGEGLEEIEREGGRVVLSPKPLETVPRLWTTGQIARVTSFENAMSLSEGEKLMIVVVGEKTEDKILDDQALWMHVDLGGPYVVTGCAYARLLNTLLHVQKLGQFGQIHGLIGGTHLIERSDEYLKRTISELGPFELNLISPCHCT